MWPYVFAAIGGAYLAQRKQPTAKCVKLDALGPRTGTQYKVDVFPSTGIHIVHGPRRNVATFLKGPDNKFTFIEADCDDEMLRNFKLDFLGVEEPSK